MWRPNVVAEAQSLRWRVEHEAWPTSDDVMARRARRARQRARDAAEALATVDVGEAESHSPAPHRVHHCGRRNRVVVDIGSSQKVSIIDLTSTGTVLITGSDEEESGMGDGGSSTPMSWLVSYVLLYLTGDRTDTLKSAATRRA
ncbi:Peptidyl-prolyl cis-trans isomerase CYP40 [Hordeum vulgare]|nr:Peptidyl-prolyl cis-trans isomerase CYP40 [Hordeum vulgare]